MSQKLRPLKFTHLEQAVSEARRLLEAGYVRQGNWTLGQICCHLRVVQDPSIDGYPGWISLFAFLWPIMRWMFLERILEGDSPVGIPTSKAFVPPNGLEDREELEKFAESVSRLQTHQGSYHPHPAFGRLARESLLQVHAAHAAHHLRFLVNGDGTGCQD